MTALRGGFFSAEARRDAGPGPSTSGLDLLGLPFRRARPAPGRPRILVLEGQDGLGPGVRRGLERDFEVLALHDSMRAAGSAVAFVPDVIMGVVAPGSQDAEQLLLRIRSIPDLDGVPFLALTDSTDPEARVRLLREGAQDFVVRPFLLEELRARLRDLVAQKRARDLLREETLAGTQSLDRLAAEATRRRRLLQGALSALGMERDAAARASESKSRLLRLVAHEVRTPLHLLRTHLETMQGLEGILPTEVRSSLRGARRAWSDLSDLVESLLSYSRVQERSQPEAASTVDMAPVVRQAVSGLRVLARSKGLRMRLRVARDLPPVAADPRMVERIAVNLVENAIKYTRQGSVTITLKRWKRRLVLQVDDTGVGIPEEFLDRIFAPFERLPSDEPRGAGLGLALVREMAGRLGGGVKVRSVPGRGSSFRVDFPLPREGRPRPQPSSEPSAIRSPGRRR